MKFVLAYTTVDGGSASEREDAERRAMQILSKFAPSVEISMWVDRLDAQGGFALFETDDPSAILKDIAIWAPLVRFELHPVMDVGDATPIQQEAIDFRDSIT
jgi:Protein of unknown function (DUF3303)